MARTKKKKVWVCFLGDVLKIHFMSPSFPGFLDYPSYHELSSKYEVKEGCPYIVLA